MEEIRVLDRLRHAIRVRQYSMATEKAYVTWIRRFILFHLKRHPAEMGKDEVEAFLTHLAVNRSVSPSTQNQALQAILFLYRQVLQTELPWMDDVVRAKPKVRIPVVLSVAETRALLDNSEAFLRLPISLLYGSGLRVAECLRLRVGDIDFHRHTIRVHAGKGGKDRATVLPGNLEDELASQISSIRQIHQHDLTMGLGKAKLPPALQRKLGKSSQRFHWQFIFPSSRVSPDPREPSARYRWHIHAGIKGAGYN